MSTEQQEQAIWERQPDEKERWYGRFWRFVRAGSNRTLLGTVHAEEQEENRKRLEAQKSPKKLSKTVPGSWRKEFGQHNWKARAEAYDDAERKRVEEQKQAYIDSILQEGYALKHERVKALGELADELRDIRKIKAQMWLSDGRGNNFQFNDAVIREYRSALADIAAEMGERVKQQIKQETNVNIDVTGAQRSLMSKLEAFAKSDKSEPDSDKPASSDSNEQPDQS